MGDIALVIGGFHHLHLSLSIFLMGSLVNQVCNIMFIYEAVGQNELLIRRTMLWNYAIMNVGVLLGVSFSGFTAIHYKYNYLFILMALLTTVCVLLVHFCLDYKKPASLKIKNKTTVCIGILAACVLIVDLMLNYCNQISVYLIMIYLFVIAYLVLYVSLYQKNSRNNLIKLVFYIAIAMTYWVGYFLSPSLIMDLIKSHVDLQLAEFQIAPQWFENIDPLITILGTSTLAILLKQRQQKNKRHFSTAFLFSMGILFVVIALYIMGYIIQYTTNTEKISPYVIGLYFLILSIGGVFIAPESLNLANQLVPESLKGFATGIALGMLGISSIIASMIAGRILLDSQSIALSYYANTFHTLFIVMLIILALTMAAAVYFRKRI
jgi:POT family proton-dependent oligopeptide transporter